MTPEDSHEKTGGEKTEGPSTPQDKQEKKKLPKVAPGRARRFAKLTRRAAMHRYDPKTALPPARTEMFVDYEAAYEWLAELNKERPREKRVTLNHLCLKAVAQSLRNHIFLNYAYDGGRRVFPVDKIDIRAPVDLGDFPEFVIVKECDTLSVQEIADSFRAERDKLMQAAMTPIERRLEFFSLPWWLLRPVYFLFKVGRAITRFFPKSHAKALERQREWLGSFMVSNPGTLGADGGVGVIVRPSITACGIWAIKPRAVVRDGEMVIRRVGKISLGFDHRFIDGGQVMRFLLEARRNIENPSRYCLKEPAEPMFPGSIGGVLP